MLPTFVVAIDLFVLMLALPQLSPSLGADSNEQLWTMDIYGFLLAGFLITMGTLGDRIGRRKLLLIGAGAFGVASLLCAYSTSPEMLIAARALLGIAGAALGPSTLGLITVLFEDPKQMATAFGIWGSTFTLGAVFGPVIGGAMLSVSWWGSVFLLGVPVMVGRPRRRPRARDRGRPARRGPVPGPAAQAGAPGAGSGPVPHPHHQRHAAVDWLSIAIMLGAASLVFARLRGIPPIGQTPAPVEEPAEPSQPATA